MNYFTAVYIGLTQDEIIAICNNEKCRFMAHSHIAHERDDLRAKLEACEKNRNLLSKELASKTQ